MKKIFVFVTAFVFSVMTCGCTSYTKVDTDQLHSFEKGIRSQFKQVKGLHVQFAPTQLQMIYTLRENTSEEERYEIFSETKKLIVSQQFQEEVIQQLYFKKYSKKEKIYPRISISFDANEDGKPVVQYTSEYYKPTVNSSAQKEIDGYQTWYYSDDYRKPGEPVTEEK